MLYNTPVNLTAHQRIKADSEAALLAAALQVASKLIAVKNADRENDTGQADRLSKELRTEDYPYLILSAQDFADNIVQTMFARETLEPAPAPPKAKPVKKN